MDKSIREFYEEVMMGDIIADYLSEGINDAAIFKAVFLAGGPGSGKSFIGTEKSSASKTLSPTVGGDPRIFMGGGQLGLINIGMRVVNPDPAYEKLLKAAGLDPKNSADIWSDKGQEIRVKATEITAKQKSLYVDGRLGVIIDGTGSNVGKVQGQKALLDKVGYECAMIYVNTDLQTAIDRDQNRSRTIGADKVSEMWNNVQKNLKKYESIFGKSNMYVVDNSNGADWHSGCKVVHKKLEKWIRRAPTDPKAKGWIESQKMRNMPKGGIRESVVELDENFIAFDLDHEVLTHFQTKADGMKWKNHKNAPDSYYLVKTKHRLLKGDMASEGSDSLSKHLDSQPFPHKDGPHFSVHKESVDEGFMDAILGKNKKNSGNPEQTKISTDIDRKLKLIDGLMKKVKPLGGKMTRLTSFRKTPIEKMTPKDLYRALNDWYLSIDDYLNDNPAVDKRHGPTVVKLYSVWEEVADKIQDYMWASGYNVKTNDPVDVINRGRVMVIRKNIDYSAPKRTDPEWLKMNESVELDEVFGAIGLGFIASTLIKVAATTLMGAIIGGEIATSRKKSAGWTARPRRENSILDLISDKATLKTMQKKYPEALEMIGKNKDIINYSKNITSTKGGPDKEQMQTLKKMIKDEFEKSGISWNDFISSVEPLVRKSVKDAKKKMDESVELDESVYDKKLAQAWKKVKSVPNIREISNSGKNHAKKLSSLLKGSPDKLTFEKLELALGTYEVHAYTAAEDKKNPHGKEDLPKLQEFCDSVDEVIGVMKNLHQSQLPEGFMDAVKQLMPGAKAKPAEKLPAKKLNAEQVKISKQIDKKLKLIDNLVQKVRPLGGQISGLVRFSKLPLEKMTPKDLYRVLNDWYDSIEDELDYGDDSVVLSKKYGRSVENLHERMEELALKIKDYMYASGYDVPHGGAKFQNQWLNKVDFSAKKRTAIK